MSADDESPSEGSTELPAAEEIARPRARVFEGDELELRIAGIPLEQGPEDFVTSTLSDSQEVSTRASVERQKLQRAAGFSESRARESLECMNVDQRVDFIVETMARLEWVRGRSARYLALVWNCALSTVENYSAEASRRCTADVDDARRDISIACNKVLRAAMDANDAQGVRGVGTLLAQVSGAMAPTQQKVEVSGPATPAQAARLVREAFGDKVISEHDETAPGDGAEPPEFGEVSEGASSE